MTSYRVEWSTDGITWATMSVPPTTTQVTVGSLRRATVYRLRVAALSPETTSPFASTSGTTATS